MLKALLSLIAICWMSSAQAGSENADPFIAAVASIKRSIAPLVCLELHDGTASLLEVKGSALFVTERGAFVTAGHVIDAFRRAAGACPVSALLRPAGPAPQGTISAVLAWFPFRPDACTVVEGIDVARCATEADLSSLDASLRVIPARIDYTPFPDGTLVAFTGFPLNTRDPLTSRAAIALYRSFLHKGAPVPELILDHAAWPGGSGSPVYLSDGRVIGLLLARGVEEGTGVAVVRPASAFRELVDSLTPPATLP